MHFKDAWLLGGTHFLNFLNKTRPAIQIVQVRKINRCKVSAHSRAIVSYLCLVGSGKLGSASGHCATWRGDEQRFILIILIHLIIVEEADLYHNE